MSLSSDLISAFAKITKDTTKKKSEKTVYGTIRESGGVKYVQLDGSELLTPISTTTNMIAGERVTVMIKNHTAIVTGNVSSPAARVGDVEGLGEAAGKVAEFEIVLADKIGTKEFYAATGRIEVLEVKTATITGELNAAKANITNLQANTVEISGQLTATNAAIERLSAGKLDADSANIKFANIDFSNIGKAAMEYFYSTSGLIKDVTVGDATITGKLVGVTITGDLIEGNTVVAEKLVIKGEDGLYYKLNTDGIKVEAQQTDYNSINGSVIKAKSITASKISVSDLVAFNATVGGFNLSARSIYSGVKESVDNTTRGIYMDIDGQMAIGDANNYLKYFKQSDGSYKLVIASENISEAAKTATNYMAYDSSNGLQIGNKSGGSWSGFRTQITGSAFNILDTAGSVVASYGAKLVELGKNASDAVIKFCGGKGQIEYDDVDMYFQMSSDTVRLKGVEMASVYSKSGTRLGAVHVSPADIQVVAGSGTTSSNIYVKPDQIMLYSDNVKLKGTVSDDTNGGNYISVVTGTSGIWTYNKWSNGDVELWGSFPISNMECNTAIGGWFRTMVFYPSSFPFTVNSPIVTASYESAGYGAVLWATTETTTKMPPNYYLIRPTSTTIANGSIKFHVRGKWK